MSATTADASPLVEHARRELELAGLFDADADYGGMAGNAVMQLVETFAAQGHSGTSAGLVMYLFQRVASYKPLTPITDDPDTWIGVSEATGEPFWQSTRDPSVFSTDGGKTWYSLDDDTAGER